MSRFECPELNDADRHEHWVDLPEIRPKNPLMRFRAWLVKVLVGDSPVAMNLTIKGGIANRFNPNGAIVTNNRFVSAPGEGLGYLVQLQHDLNQKVLP